MRYGKLIDGNIEYVATNKIDYDGGTIIMPTEEQLNEHGIYAVENADEVGTDHVEGNVIKHYVGHERTLDEAKEQKIAEIDTYDTSDDVNGFIYQGQTLWIDKATRVGLVNAINATKALGESEVTFGISGISVTMSCDVALAMLAQLEVYALACYNVTLAHKTEVGALTTIEAVDAYDVAVGYPDKLEF